MLLDSTGLLFGRVAKDFPFFEQEKSIKVEGMKRVDTMFTSVTTENQHTKSSLEVMMMEKAVLLLLTGFVVAGSSKE